MRAKQFAVIGLGRFGTSVATTLLEMGHEVLAIDSDMARVESVQHRVTHAVVADATDKETVVKLGLRNFDAVIVSIGQNVQASVLTTVILNEVEVPYIIAKAQNELHGKMLQKVGVDRVVYPERDIGNRVAHNLIMANVLDYIELSPQVRVLEMAAPEGLTGLSLASANLGAKYSANVIAIKRGELLIPGPSPEEEIQTGDIMIIIGETKGLHRFEQME